MKNVLAILTVLVISFSCKKIHYSPVKENSSSKPSKPQFNLFEEKELVFKGEYGGNSHYDGKLLIVVPSGEDHYDYLLSRHYDYLLSRSIQVNYTFDLKLAVRDTVFDSKQYQGYIDATGSGSHIHNMSIQTNFPPIRYERGVYYERESGFLKSSVYDPQEVKFLKDNIKPGDIWSDTVSDDRIYTFEVIRDDIKHEGVDGKIYEVVETHTLLSDDHIYEEVYRYYNKRYGLIKKYLPSHTNNRYLDVFYQRKIDGAI